MAARFLGFLAFLLLYRVGAGGPLAVPASCSIDCGAGSGLALFADEDGMRFLVDGEEVSVALFCSAVGVYGEDGCDLDGLGDGEQWRRIRGEYCSGSGLFGSAAVRINRISSRKIARHVLENSSVFSKLAGDAQLEKRQKDHPSSRLSSKQMIFIASSTFLICCIFLCPCFQAKMRDNPHESISPGKLNQADSVPSPLVTSTLPEITLATQIRIPPSPIRVPPSPLRVPPSPSRISWSPQLSRAGSVHLTVREISRATQNFSPSNIIGEGVFGTVYKAQLPDGQVVSIKRARKEQAANLHSEFSNEVELLSKIEHRNLVRLLGYTEKGNERIIITEYVPNGNLREHLDGKHGNILDFHQRLEISIDVAHALTYLHSYSEKQIVHRDVKSSNILLTEGFRAKVADFGFARSGSADDDQTTKVKGTAGYIDPEYLRTSKLTPKSDVFSFGILLIEILSGRRPVELKRANDEKITIKWAFKKYDGGQMMEILDPELEEVVDKEIVSKLFDLAFQCAAPTRADRPEMKEVVEKLWEIRKDYGRNRRSRS